MDYDKLIERLKKASADALHAVPTWDFNYTCNNSHHF